MTSDDKKKNAAIKALEFVEDGMTLGLGTGSTAEHFVIALADLVKQGHRFICAATSERTADLAQSLGIEVRDIDDVGRIHMTVDGADEVDPNLQLIKGGGGALLREKIVAAASDRMIVIVDDGKMVDPLGAFPLPVEVVPFGWKTTAAKLADLLMKHGCASQSFQLRESQGIGPFVTDGGHYIVDCGCQRIPDPAALAEAISCLPGVVDHGLFIDLATTVIVGRDSDTQILKRPGR